MYQSVGHQVIDLYSKALGEVPLYRRQIKGTAVNIEMHYSIPDKQFDEVEDLFELLTDIKVDALIYSSNFC